MFVQKRFPSTVGGQMGASLYCTVTKKVPEDHGANPNWFVCNWGLSIHLGEL